MAFIVRHPGCPLPATLLCMFNKRLEVECHLETIITGKASKQVPESVSTCEVCPSGDVNGPDLCELSHQAALLFGGFRILFSSRGEPFPTGPAFLSFLS